MLIFTTTTAAAVAACCWLHTEEEGFSVEAGLQKHSSTNSHT